MGVEGRKRWVRRVVSGVTVRAMVRNVELNIAQEGMNQRGRIDEQKTSKNGTKANGRQVESKTGGETEVAKFLELMSNELYKSERRSW